jgi:hypothetical protein
MATYRCHRIAMSRRRSTHDVVAGIRRLIQTLGDRVGNEAVEELACFPVLEAELHAQFLRARAMAAHPHEPAALAATSTPAEPEQRCRHCGRPVVDRRPVRRRKDGVTYRVGHPV